MSSSIYKAHYEYWDDLLKMDGLQMYTSAKKARWLLQKWVGGQRHLRAMQGHKQFIDKGGLRFRLSERVPKQNLYLRLSELLD
ncbi:MAG: hypothetical protein ACRYFK_01675 [Janthinobacterium lividum]